MRGEFQTLNLVQARVRGSGAGRGGMDAVPPAVAFRDFQARAFGRTLTVGTFDPNVTGSFFSEFSGRAMSISQAHGMMAMTDGDGFTVLTPSSDSRLIYVSSSTGNDFTGQNYSPSDPEIGSNYLLPGAVMPYASASVGVAQLRDGFPDYILFLRGDTFNSGLISTAEISGRNVAERMVFGAYGSESNARPVFSSTGNIVQLGLASGAGDFKSDNLAFVSMEFDSSGRATNDNSQGIWWRCGGDNLLLEDLYVHHGRYCILMLNHGGNMSNMIVRRNVFSITYYIDTSSGWFLNQGNNGYTISSLLVEENLWHHCGFEDTLQPAQTFFNHGIYFSTQTDASGNVYQPVMRNNWFVYNSHNGCQQRVGGDCIRNVFLENTIHLNWGHLQGGGNPVSGGVTGSIVENLFQFSTDLNQQLGSGDPDFANRGRNVNFANVASCTVRDNVIAHTDSASGGSANQGWNLEGSIGGETTVGLNNVTMRNNLGYDVRSPVEFGVTQWGGPEFTDGNVYNFTMQSNHWENPTNPPWWVGSVMWVGRTRGMASGSFNSVFSNNTYFCFDSGTAGGGTGGDESEWHLGGIGGNISATPPSTYTLNSAGSFTEAGFIAGDMIRVGGFSNGVNNGVFEIDTVTDSNVFVVETTLVMESGTGNEDVEFLDPVAESLWHRLTGETNSITLSNATSFTDPNRSPSNYHDFIESTTGSTRQDLYDKLLAQRKGNWRTDLETLAYINYVRAGFDLADLT